MKKQKAKLVSLSKTLHFLLPNPVMPMDGKFTKKLLKNKWTKKRYKDAKKDIRKFSFNGDFKKFGRYFLTSNIIARDLRLKSGIKNFNQIPVPKLIDNALIELK